jgi:hypothetical protein
MCRVTVEIMLTVMNRISIWRRLTRNSEFLKYLHDRTWDGTCLTNRVDRR